MNERWNDEEAHWFVLKSQTKREHIAAKILADVEDVEVFCPRIKFQKATRRGKIWWVEPLFPGYLFAKFLYRERYRHVTSSHGISQVVSFGGRIPALPDEAISELQRQAQEHSEDDTIEFKPSVEAGDEVELSDGPFKGIQATVQEPLPSTERVRILIEFLGEEQVVEVDLFSLILPQRPKASDELSSGGEIDTL